MLVILNQGAAKYWNNKYISVYNNSFFINALMLRMPQIVIFGMFGCRQFFSPKW